MKMSQQDKQIAQTILQQIKAIDFWALGAWGAKDYTILSKEYSGASGVRFKTSGMVSWKGFVAIRYNEGSDLYDIEFFRIWKRNKKVDKSVEGVYVENLIEVINSQVG